MKACPECKSKNTRQMDREHYPDQAYCLSCYNRFRSAYKEPEPVNVGPKRMDSLRARIKTLQEQVKNKNQEIEGLKNGQR
jgi:Zn ribbon nucleic-acid-binding protein